MWQVSKKIEKEIERLLSVFPSLNVTSEIAKIAAQFYKKYQPEVVDSLIAAAAFCFNAVLVTRNIKHFQRIKEIKVKSL